MNFSKSHSPINFRSFGFIAVTMIVTVACAYAYLHIRIVGICLFCAECAAIVTVAIVKTVSFVKNRSGLGLTVTLWISAVLCASAFIFAAVTAEEWSKYGELSGEHDVRGRVCGFYTSDGNIGIDLCDLSFEGVGVPGKLRLTMRSSDDDITEFINVGDILSFNAKVNCKKLLDGYRVNGSAYRTDIRY